MQKYKSISSLWNVMLKEQATGLVKRLLPSNTPIKVFATYRHSDEVCGIAFSYSENLKVSIDSFLNLKELYVQLYLDAAYKSNKLLKIFRRLLVKKFSFYTKWTTATKTFD